MRQPINPSPRPDPGTASALGRAPVASLRDVSHRYGDTAALSAVDLSLLPGEVTALLGPNGAGKTTAVKLLLGLLRPNRGEARLFGGDPGARENRRRVGVLLQVSGIPETLRVVEHLRCFRAYYPRPLAVEELLRLSGLEEQAQRLYGRLSGGQRQRLAFALALCGNPDLLILDEPTVGLDVAARRRVWHTIEELRDAGKSILLTTHYLEEADVLADRVVLLDRGRVLADGTANEIRDSVGGRRVRCRSSVSVTRAAQLPGVRAARGDGSRLDLLVSDAETTVRALLDRDPRLTELEVARADLEEAFLALTGADRASAVTTPEVA